MIFIARSKIKLIKTDLFFLFTFGYELLQNLITKFSINRQFVL